jgi:HNH endonuclease
MDREKRVYPEAFLAYIQSITNKRAKVVIDHILAHGFITTEDLEKTYGYNHPPRAARDVREAGIPLETFKIKSQDGKSIASYQFGELASLQTSRVAGRITFSKDFKHILFVACGGHCQVCNGQFEERYLQIDHRVPYEVGGDVIDRAIAHFMLLCGSCNRAKSWSCEHCDNWKTEKQASVCMQCYWGNPENYNHIAMEKVRRLDMQWNGDETEYYDALKIIADHHNIELPELIKQLIEERIQRK